LGVGHRTVTARPGIWPGKGQGPVDVGGSEQVGASSEVAEIS